MKVLSHFFRISCMILLTAILFTNCEKDSYLPNSDEEFAPSLKAISKEAHHALPFKVQFSAIYNPDWIPGDPSIPNGWLSGQATYFGNLQMENSPFWYLSEPTPLPTPDDPNYPVRVQIFNYLTAANGDRAMAVGYLDINPTLGTFIGHFDVYDDGTNSGRFVGVTGYTNITADNPGYTDPNSGNSYWEAEGEITFQGK